MNVFASDFDTCGELRHAPTIRPPGIRSAGFLLSGVIHGEEEAPQRRRLLMAISINPSRKGLLHKKLGVPQGKKIPAGKLAAAKRSTSPSLRKEANFAINAKKFKH